MVQQRQRQLPFYFVIHRLQSPPLPPLSRRECSKKYGVYHQQQRRYARVRRISFRLLRLGDLCLRLPIVPRIAFMIAPGSIAAAAVLLLLLLLLLLWLTCVRVRLLLRAADSLRVRKA